MSEILQVIGRHLYRRIAAGTLAVFALLCSALVSAQGQASVVMSLSSPQVAFEDSVTLEVIARGVDGELDTRALEQAFDITGRSESTQVRIINGVNDSLRRWALQLNPRTTGRVTVPAVVVGGIESNVLSLNVGAAPAGADRVLFMELDVDEPRPWVQQQVYMTLRIFHRIRLEQYQVDAPSVSDTTVFQIDGEVTGEEEIDGVRYSVLEKRFAAFPQQSGLITLPPMTLTAIVPADPSRVRTFLSPTRRVTRRTDEIQLDVQPRPSDVTANWWLPSRSLELTGEWSDDISRVQVGEPLSRQLRIRAEGVLATQLPEVNAPDVDGLSIYADQPVDETIAEIDGLVTERLINWAIIPERPGPMTIPAVEIEWFDTVTGSAQVAQLPEQTINVLAAPGATGSAASASQSPSVAAPVQAPLSEGSAEDVDEPSVPVSSLAVDSIGIDQRWRMLAFAALLGWAITTIAFVWRERGRGRRSRSVTAHAAADLVRTQDPLQMLESAAQKSDYVMAAEAIRAWGRVRSPGASPGQAPGLAAIAANVSDARIAADLRSLEQRLYANHTSERSDIDLTELHRALKGLSRHDRKARASKAPDADLPAL